MSLISFITANIAKKQIQKFEKKRQIVLNFGIIDTQITTILSLGTAVLRFMLLSRSGAIKCFQN